MAKFGDLMSCSSKLYSNMHPVSCTNTHHDVTVLVNHGMVKNAKTWISLFFKNFFGTNLYKVQSSTITEIKKYKKKHYKQIKKKKNIQRNKKNNKSPSHPPSVLFTMYY